MIRETMNGNEAKLIRAKFLRTTFDSLNIDRIKESPSDFSGDYAVILPNGTELAPQPQLP